MSFHTISTIGIIEVHDSDPDGVSVDMHVQAMDSGIIHTARCRMSREQAERLAAALLDVPVHALKALDAQP